MYKVDLPNKVSETVGNFIRHVYFVPAFDKRDPSPNKNYGISDVKLVFALQGEKGTITLALFTNWYLPNNKQELELKGYTNFNWLGDFSYHIPDKEGGHECPWVEGNKCESDGTSLGGEQLFKEFVEHGLDHIWEKLEEKYKEWIKND